jgi:hypothetical protein
MRIIKLLICIVSDYITLLNKIKLLGVEGALLAID